MRVLIILLGIGLSSSYANSSYSQTKIDIAIKDASLIEFFEEIQANTEFVFFYKDDVLKDNLRISVNLEKASLEKVLQSAFSNTSLAYKISEKQVVVKRLAKKSNESTAINRKKQQETITVAGNVTEAETGMPVPAANILEKGTSNGVMTDFDGNYSIEVPENAILKVSYIGYATKEIKVNGRNEIDIVLEQDTDALDEVVVMGYGTQSRRKVTSSISSIDMDEINEIPASSVSQTLSGKAAGLNVNFNSAQPGGDISFQIRGSATGREPLIVIDGMPTSDFNPSSAGTFGNGSIDATLATLNPSDIESIDILKDASATAIYGSKAAGGVILITTKKGRRSGDKSFSVDLNVSSGIQQFYDIPKMLNAVDYMKQTNEVLREEHLYESREDIYSEVSKPNGWMAPGEFQPYYNNDEIQEFENGVRSGTDFVDEITRLGTVQDANLSVSGNSRNTRFYSSFNVYDQKGIIKNNGLTKFNGRLNVTQEFSDNFTGGITINYSQINNNNVQIGNGGLYENSGILLSALQFDPTLPVRNEDGEYQLNIRQSNFPNPVSYLDISNETNIERFLNTAYLKYDILPELYVKTQVGFDRTQSASYGYLPTTTIAGKSYNGRADRAEDKNSNYQFQLLVNYDKSFNEKHNITALLGTEYMKYEWEGHGITATDFPYDGVLWNNLGLGANRPSVWSYGGSTETASYFSQLSYDYDFKYFLSANFRLDGSANFSPEDQYGFFPGISVGWDISQERFMDKSSDWLDQLKLRAGYGETGNDNIGSAFSDWYSPGANTMWGSSVISGVKLAGLGNPDLKWEKQVDINVGVDFSLLENRITGSVEYFNRVVSRILGRRNLVSSNPVNNIFYNLDAEKQTYGTELTLNTQNIKKPEFSWNSLLTFSHYRDRWLKRDPSYVLGINESPNQYFGELWFYESDGLVEVGNTDDINSIPGTIRIKDVDGYLLDDEGNRVTNENGQPQYSGEPDGKIDAADLVKVGTNSPYTVGFSNNFRYKNFDLSIDAYGIFNRRKINSTKTTLGGPSVYNIITTGSNNIAETKDRWNSNNLQGSGPSALQAFAKYGTGDYYLEKAWFIRVKNIAFGYTFPNRTLETMNIKKLRVYANLLNPFLFTPYSGMDPETDNYVAAYPNQHTYSLGLQLSF
ncbi:TonB-dependent receptor [Salegentibacter holothuriorum]|nr:TonB-dependent receptor [Salegentibacter holothuriorum]